MARTRIATFRKRHYNFESSSESSSSDEDRSNPSGTPTSTSQDVISLQKSSQLGSFSEGSETSLAHPVPATTKKMQEVHKAASSSHLSQLSGASGDESLFVTADQSFPSGHPLEVSPQRRDVSPAPPLPRSPTRERKDVGDREDSARATGKGPATDNDTISTSDACSCKDYDGRRHRSCIVTSGCKGSMDRINIALHRSKKPKIVEELQKLRRDAEGSWWCGHHEGQNNVSIELFICL